MRTQEISVGVGEVLCVSVSYRSFSGIDRICEEVLGIAGSVWAWFASAYGENCAKSKTGSRVYPVRHRIYRGDDGARQIPEYEHIRRCAAPTTNQPWPVHICVPCAVYGGCNFAPSDREAQSQVTYRAVVLWLGWCHLNVRQCGIHPPARRNRDQFS